MDDDPDDLHTDRAHPARMYDYLLGGRTHYPADRDAADAVIAVMPTARAGAVAQRAFMHRAIRFAAEDGITQFLDIGTGIPTEPNLHRIAQSVQPTARVVYVDNDRIAAAHAAGFMGGDPRGTTAYLHANAKDPDAVLASREVRTLIDWNRPVAVSIIGLLHFLDDVDAFRLVSTLRRAMVPGSLLIISNTTLDVDVDGRLRAVEERYRRAGIETFSRVREPLESVFLSGCEVVDPGVVIAHRWRPDVEPTSPDSQICIWVAVGRRIPTVLEPGYVPPAHPS